MAFINQVLKLTRKEQKNKKWTADILIHVFPMFAFDPALPWNYQKI